MLQLIATMGNSSSMSSLIEMSNGNIATEQLNCEW